jgi:hypothetical protein
MLSKKQLDEFRKQIGQKVTFDVEEIIQGGILFYVGKLIEDQWGVVEYQSFSFANRFESIPSCCGVMEIEGVEVLEKLNPTQIALLALWLHSPACDEGMSIIATTAKHPKAAIPRAEQVLSAVGFTPTIRGVNPNSGNIVTLWTFQTSTPLPLPKGAYAFPAKNRRTSSSR